MDLPDADGQPGPARLCVGLFWAALMAMVVAIIAGVILPERSRLRELRARADALAGAVHTRAGRSPTRPRQPDQAALDGDTAGQ